LSIKIILDDKNTKVLSDKSASYSLEKLKSLDQVDPVSFWKSIDDWNKGQNYFYNTINSSYNTRYSSDHHQSGYGQWDFIDFNIGTSNTQVPLLIDTKNRAHMNDGVMTYDSSLAPFSQPTEMIGYRFAGNISPGFTTGNAGGITVSVTMDTAEIAAAMPDNTAVSHEFHAYVVVSTAERSTGDWTNQTTIPQEIHLYGAGNAQLLLPANLDGATVNGRPAESASYTMAFEDRYLVRAADDAQNQLAEVMTGDGAANRISGGLGDDVIHGRAGNDVLQGGLGADTIDGGLGSDTAVWSGLQRAYDISLSARSSSTVVGTEGNDVITQTERFSFVDGEFRIDTSDVAAQVYRLYGATLDRTPESGGLKQWVMGLESGALTLQQAADGFTSSREFQSKYGNLDNAGFVDLLYENVLSRDPDPAGFQHWLNTMADGMNRSNVVLAFSESAENIELTRSAVEQGIWVRDDQAAMVARLYDTTLDRQPDAQGLNTWVNAIKGGMTPQQAANGFTGSPEFQQKYGSLDDTAFVQQLYRNVLDREGEVSGVETWKGALQGGMSRADIVLGFSESLEHQNKLAPYIDDGIWFL
jgi:hypothetical protein